MRREFDHQRTNDWQWLCDHSPDEVSDETLSEIYWRLYDGTSPQQDCVASWRFGPFAAWATMPTNFVFPSALLEHLAIAESLDLYHACESCGLRVPCFGAMPSCPSCGGATSAAANWRPGGTEPQ